MPADHRPQPVSIDSPAAMLAVIPHLLGFTPENSLIVVGGRGPRQRIEATLRFDLPNPPGQATAKAIADHTVSVLTCQRFTTVVVIGYGLGELVTPLTRTLRRAITRSGLEVRDVLRVQDGRYWSYLCKNPACCPPEGVPFDTTTHPAGRIMAAIGRPILASREELAASIVPVTGPVAETMRQETDRAERIAARLLADATKAGSTVRPVVDRGLGAVQAAIGIYRDGGTITEASQFAWLALTLASLQVRDDAWARMDPTHREDHLRLWADVTRHAQPGYAAAPASLLAFTAWQGGNGALANVALDRALADTPGYSMALLLRDTIDAGAPPSLARLPMTPEEVAASYEERPGEGSTDQAEPGSADAGEDRAS
jgi:Domain of unknown function (DUF4192)